MSGGRRRRPSIPILLAVALMATLFAAPVGAAGATPTLRLFVSSTQITVERNRHGFVSIDPGAWVTPVTDDFELWVSRPDYDTPITIKQVDADTKAVLRTFSAKNLEGWTGLKGFGHYVVEDANGEIVLEETVPFCPNSWQRERLSDDGPIALRLPRILWRRVRGALHQGIDLGPRSGMGGTGRRGLLLRVRMEGRPAPLHGQVLDRSCVDGSVVDRARGRHGRDPRDGGRPRDARGRGA